MTAFKSPVAWINGQICSFETASIPLWDLGVVAGASVTEMVRTFRHRPFRLTEHLDRFWNSCQSLEILTPFSLRSVEQAVGTVVEINSQLIPAGSDLGIVIFQTAGANPTYLGGQAEAIGSCVVHTFPLPFGMWKKNLVQGMSLRIPSIRQIPSDCLPMNHKIRNRMHWWLADREVNRIEAGSRALLLDHEGRITETSTSCFFLVQNGEVLTPQANVLQSMSRQVVEQLCRSKAIPFRETDIHVEDLLDADEAFVSSSPVGLLPVRQIDGRPFPSTVPGPIFQQLLAAWSDLCGVDMADQILTQS